MGSNNRRASFPDLSGGFAQSLALRADLQARLLDFLARKQLPFSRRIEALIRLAESTLTRERIRSTVRSVLKRFRRERRLGEGSTQGELELFLERVHGAPGEGRIESYPAYLFTVDQSF